MSEPDFLGRLLARIPERVGRIAGLVFFLGVIAWRIKHYQDTDYWKPLWAVETGIFVLIAVAYLLRRPARERASRWPEIVLPLIGSALPFALVLSHDRPRLAMDEEFGVPLALGLMIAGSTISLVSYVFLGGSFSIFVEARSLRAAGPYRYVRHPVYVGQAIATVGILVVWWYPVNFVIEAAFIAIQVARAVLEERKLMHASPDYAVYRAKTWMFIPFVV